MDTIDKAPEAHVFTDQQVNWITFHDGLPQVTADDAPLRKYSAIKPME